jgi:hypothetical protein
VLRLAKMIHKKCCVLAALALCAACTGKLQWGLPAVAVSAVSPNREFTASVRNHISLDPPDQTLVLRGPAGETVLQYLIPDEDWSDQIAWSPDSGEVGFLIRDVHVALYGTDGRLRREVDLVPRHRDHYLERFSAKNLQHRGDRLTYLLCERTDDFKGMKPNGCHEASLPLN